MKKFLEHSQTPAELIVELAGQQALTLVVPILVELVVYPVGQVQENVSTAAAERVIEGTNPKLH